MWLGGIAEFIRRLTFSVLIGNVGKHLKNWSLIYPDARNAASASAYGFISTIACIKDSETALKCSRTKRFDRYSKDGLSHLAAKALLPEKVVLDTACETVPLFLQHWNVVKSHLLLSGDGKAIEDHLKNIPWRRDKVLHQLREDRFPRVHDGCPCCVVRYDRCNYHLILVFEVQACDTPLLPIWHVQSGSYETLGQKCQDSRERKCQFSG